MNTIIFHAFRAATVLGIALFAFVGNVFAAPALTPASVSRISETSATLSGHVSNIYKNTAVWFEVTNASGAMTAVGVQPPLYDGGTGVAFDYTLENLIPGQTYTYRSAAMEGGVTVYSPSATFTTSVPKPVATVTTVSKTVTPAPAAQTTTAAKTTTTTATKDTTATKTPASTEGFTNNGASVLGAGNGMLPTTLAGWILLLIMILAAVLLGHMIYDSLEKRKEAQARKKREQEEEKENK